MTMSNAILEQYKAEIAQAGGDHDQLDWIYRSMYYFEYRGQQVTTLGLSYAMMHQWATNFLTTREQNK